MRRGYVTAPPPRAARAPAFPLVRSEAPLFCDTCGGEVVRGFDPVGAHQLRLVWTCLRCERVLDEQAVTLRSPAA